MTAEEAQEAEDELFRITMKTEHSCAGCSDVLCLTDEVVVITVVAPTIENNDIRYAIAEADDSDFLYEPRFMDYGCWENTANELGAELDNLPPIDEISAVVLCRICSSGICLGELMGLVTKGELHCSQRSPEIASTTIFDEQDPDPDPVCIVCLSKLSEEYLALWDSVGQGDECEDGKNIRCWRHGCPGADNCLLKRS